MNTQNNGIKISWGHVITNALSLLVGSTFKGAGIIVWNAVMSMDDRINATLQGTTKVLIKDLADLRTEVGVLKHQLQVSRKDLLERLNVPNGMDSGAVSPLEGWVPPPLESWTKPDRDERYTQNLERLAKEIEPYQQQMKIQLQ